MSLSHPAGQQSSRERRVPFAGITNLRDLGGYPTPDGGTTRGAGVPGRRPAQADRGRPRRVRDPRRPDVYDLRGDVERAEFPGPVASRARADRRADPPMLHTARRHHRDDRRGRRADAARHVRRSLDHSATQIGGVLRGLADPDRTPAVFHCHGGKDRTGLVAAVLLLALGVDRETVLDDYEATSLYRLLEDQQDSLANMLAAGSPEAAAGVLGTPRWAMAAAVDARRLPAGVDGFLTGPAGLEPSELAGLRGTWSRRPTPSEARRSERGRGR